MNALILLINIILAQENAPPGRANASNVRIQVEGFRTTAGHLALSLFAEKDQKSFPDKAAQALMTRYIVIDEKKSVTVELANLPPGRYAIAVMHDEDSDGKFKTGFLGIPREGFGFSKNPAVVVGPPGFSAASFDSQIDKAQTIKIKYMF